MTVLFSTGSRQARRHMQQPTLVAAEIRFMEMIYALLPRFFHLESELLRCQSRGAGSPDQAGDRPRKRVIQSRYLEACLRNVGRDKNSELGDLRNRQSTDPGAVPGRVSYGQAKHVHESH